MAEVAAIARMGHEVESNTQRELVGGNAKLCGRSKLVVEFSSVEYMTDTKSSHLMWIPKF